MKFIIKHQIKGRIRIHLVQDQISFEQADILCYYLQNVMGITQIKIYERTADVAISYAGDRQLILDALKEFQYETVCVPSEVIESSGRRLNAEFQERLVKRIGLRYLGRLFVPDPVRFGWTCIRAFRYLLKGIKVLSKGRLEVEVLDAAAICVSVVRGDMNTAGSVMFLLGVGELLEEWTHKKSVADLARSMSLKIEKVWKIEGGQQILTVVSQVNPGDAVVVRMGNVIPFDGTVLSGEGLINQSSLTGESMPVRKEQHGYVYAGTVLEEGEVIIEVVQKSGATRFEKIVTMIEESERLKSTVESKAERLADKLVPYTLAGTVITWLLTRNVTKALSVLMVDFSCALKLAMPISVLSAIREAGQSHITVKGGKFMEAVADATTIVFDKTGTLTKAQPSVKEVITFNGKSPEEMLRIAACLEEHFPHSMANAVVQAAKEKNLEHEEMHSQVEYIVAHGISSFIDGKKVIIGSYHFVFEDEGCSIDEAYQDRFGQLSDEYSHLYLAIEQQLAAVICIEDPIRTEAATVISELRRVGIRKIVMMTGDSERTAAAVAAKIGVDEYYSEVLPEDKASFIEKERSAGQVVIMVGDGINDSPALSAADVGIAISDGAEIAREIADITIAADNLYELVTLKQLSDFLMQRIRGNYRSIVGINTALILLGISGVIQPTTSALLHNTSTLAISMRSMRNLIS